MLGKRFLSVFLSLAVGKKTFDSAREKIQGICDDNFMLKKVKT